MASASTNRLESEPGFPTPNPRGSIDRIRVSDGWRLRKQRSGRLVRLAYVTPSRLCATRASWPMGFGDLLAKKFSGTTNERTAQIGRFCVRAGEVALSSRAGGQSARPIAFILLPLQCESNARARTQWKSMPGNCVRSHRLASQCQWANTRLP